MNHKEQKSWEGGHLQIHKILKRKIVAEFEWNLSSYCKANEIIEDFE